MYVYPGVGYRFGMYVCTPYSVVGVVVKMAGAFCHVVENRLPLRTYSAAVTGEKAPLRTDQTYIHGGIQAALNMYCTE